MKLLLLGATGRTGKLILIEAVKKGYSVNCLVRKPEKVGEDFKGTTIFKGSTEIISDLDQAIEGCEVIINALNISRKSDFPWSKLRTQPTFLSDVMRNVIFLSEKHHIKRVVICSAWGVSDTNGDIPSWFKWFIDNSNIELLIKTMKDRKLC